MTIKRIIASIIILLALSTALVIGLNARPAVADDLAGPVMATPVTEAQQANVVPQSSMRYHGR